MWDGAVDQHFLGNEGMAEMFGSADGLVSERRYLK